MAITQYRFFPYGDTVNYKKFDVFVDTSVPRYYYATQDNLDQPVTSYYDYAISSWSRDNDIVTLYYTKTGSGPNFTQGSMIVATGQSDSYLHYTGMIIDGTPNYIRYLNAGPDITSNTPAGRLKTVLNPCWTTGFYFLPSYSSNLEIKVKTINTQFGDGYSQRQRDGINSISNSYNVVFENRSDKEMKSILNFIQDKAGVEAFKILSSTSAVSNNPELKYTAVDPKINQQSYNSNTVSFTLNQVFDQ